MRRKIALTLLGLTLAAALGTWLLRDRIGTYTLRSKLESHGFTCDERLALRLSGGLDQAHLGPFACDADEGRVARFELLQAATATALWGSVRSVNVPSARLEIRRRSTDGEPAGAALLRRMNLHGRALRLLQVLARASESPALPAITIGALEVSREGSVKAQVEDLTLSPGAQLSVSAQRVTLPAAGSSFASLELLGLSGTVDGREASFSGSADARLGPLHSLRPWRFTLSASELDGEAQLELVRLE